MCSVQKALQKAKLKRKYEYVVILQVSILKSFNSKILKNKDPRPRRRFPSGAILVHRKPIHISLKKGVKKTTITNTFNNKYNTSGFISSRALF